MRNKKQKIIDMLLNLRMIQEVSKKTAFDGLLMLQKTVFAAAEKYKESNERVLSESFYRWDWGPMSEEVYEDFGQMKDLGLIQGEKDEEIELTERGASVLTAVNEVFQDNVGLLGPLDEVALNVRDLDTLLDEIYSMKVYVEELDDEMEIGKIPEGTEMLSPVWEDKAKAVFRIDNSWLETLDLLLDADTDSKIRKSISDVRRGRIHPLELD